MDLPAAALRFVWRVPPLNLDKRLRLATALASASNSRRLCVREGL
jgi:hypothetical protein